jgi:SAM-dependent methyltransferase
MINRALNWGYQKLPQSFKDKINPEGIEVREFMKSASGEIPDNALLIDAGAGNCPFKSFFPQVRYISIDSGLGGVDTATLDIIGDIYSMPFKTCSVDVILCTKVLEHVTEPKQLLLEFFRVLKRGGKLFMTVPFGEGLHMRPYDYFRYTEFGLSYLLQTIGFEVVRIEAYSGYYSLIGYRIRVVGYHIQNKLIKFALFPFLCFLVPYICYLLDKRDKNKHGSFSFPLHTGPMGYIVYCRKPGRKEVKNDKN